MPRQREDYTGKKFNYFTVIEFAEDRKDSKGKPLWKCKCVCGQIRHLPTGEVKREKQKSCGCMTREIQQESSTTHNMSKTRLYRIWDAMKGRCNRKTHKHYRYYGGRGISVCKEWSNSFEAFMDWAMKNGYEENLSIDRKDVDGNYEPSNCKWSTQKEQMNNRRVSKK